MTQGFLWRDKQIQRFFWHNQQKTLNIEERSVACPPIEKASFSAGGEWLVCTHPNAFITVWWLLERKLELVHEAKLPAVKAIDFLLVHPHAPLFTLQVGQALLFIQLAETSKKTSLQQAIAQHFSS